MLTWCSRAVNFCFYPSLAASRTRSSPLGPLSRLGVRHGLGSSVFSLVSGLSSTTSAGDPSLLFGCFAGTTPLYDSPSPFMRDLSLIAFSLRPSTSIRATMGSPGSRAWSFSACLGSLTPPGCDALALSHAALPSSLLTPSAPGNTLFRSSIPSLHIPLSNASSAPLRPPSHGSGPEWFATPSPVRLSHSLLHAGLSRRTTKPTLDHQPYIVVPE